MKANELSCKDLMIGDWVIFHDSGYASDGTTWEENRVCQIDSIDGDVRVEWYDEDGCKEDWPHVSTVFLSPIPLTPEILEKNEFKSYIPENHLETIYACQDVWKAVADELYALWPYQDGSFYLLLRVNGKDMVRMDVHYVHQLQHALRLCKIEKEIIL